MLRREWIYLYKKEFYNYFNTPIGYVFLVVCLLVNFSFFFLGIMGLVPPFWETHQANIRGYMTLLPVSFILFVPAVTMRLWSEERKSGTIEVLRTLPFNNIDLILSKFLAAWTFVSILIFASLPLCLITWILGDHFDYGTHLCMYIGATLMAGAYVSMGLVLSAITREQIVAFILIFLASFFMFISNYYILNQHLEVHIANFIGFFSHSYHYSSFGRGMLVWSDIFYFISFITLMLSINAWILRRER